MLSPSHTLRSARAARRAVPPGDPATIAANIRRVMARDGLTFENVVAATGLDERTIRGLVRGASNPHARTLHKLCGGLGISTDELFQRAPLSPSRRFDRATNGVVESVIAERAEMFAGWTGADFDELYSRFGAGGQLTEAGVCAAAAAMNAKRRLWRQISVILESGEAELLAEMVDMLYRRATTTSGRSHGWPNEGHG